MKFAVARAFIEAVVAGDLKATEEFLDPDVETVTPRGTLRGIAACRRVLGKASGDEQFAVEQTAPEFEETDGEIVARTHEIARWRETGDIAYERDFAVRLTLNHDTIVRIVVMPGGSPPTYAQPPTAGGSSPRGVPR
jgi:ketosteroid isomerase-like protein